ncbi:MAG: hypothetical protein IKI98_01795 [Spirochaetaceae bacterium]|nr:hypothetical protein [Spirochaetaceae bacterium]
MINLILSLLLIFPLVFQKNLVILFIQFILMIIFAFIRKKRVKLLPSFFITLSLVFFSLLSPFGKVWFSIGNFTITEGAFLLGLKKSFVLCGMVFISQIATSFEFNIKGNFGKMISEVFYWFSIFSDFSKKAKSESKLQINENKKSKLSLKSIDEYLCELYFEEQQEKNNNTHKTEESDEKFWTILLILLNCLFYFLI